MLSRGQQTIENTGMPVIYVYDNNWNVLVNKANVFKNYNVFFRPKLIVLITFLNVWSYGKQQINI